jgi:hypothetical protein
MMTMQAALDYGRDGIGVMLFAQILFSEMTEGRFGQVAKIQ